MVMERDSKKDGHKLPHGHHVGVGGREYPTQIGRTCDQQMPGDSEKKESGHMSWNGHSHHRSHHKS